MAQTITTIYSAISLPGNTTVQTGSPTKTVLQAGTLYVDLSVLITQSTEQSTSNAGSSVPKQSVRVWFAILPFSLTVNSTLPQQLMQAAQFMDCRVPTNGSSITRLSQARANSGHLAGCLLDVLWNNGGNLYTWYDSPPLSVLNNTPPTLTLTSVEF